MRRVTPERREGDEGGVALGAATPKKRGETGRGGGLLWGSTERGARHLLQFGDTHCRWLLPLLL